LQQKRRREGRSARTVNYEVGTLRSILKTCGLWAPIRERVKALRQRHEVGRALSRDDEVKLLEAIRRSDSPALLTLFITAIDTGLRASEMRGVRYRDLELAWKEGAIVAGRLIVPKSKTDAGTGRVIPFTRRLCVTLSSWVARFPHTEPESYIFPHHRVACRGGFSQYHLYETDLRRPIGSWKRAWKYACRKSDVAYRWHDLRHTFVSRLAENPAVSEETIRALAGHVSKQMLQRYSHIRMHAKEAAILSLETAEIEDSAGEAGGERAQNRAESPTDRLH
jgi:integrase